MFTSSDHEFMARALRLAGRGLYSTMPNPRVGCVLVREAAIIGEGWHQQTGGPHAEIHALKLAGDARGATAYVTLEPCSHHGRTPPCAEALIAAGLARVVIAVQDPNPQVAGRGMAMLTAAGIATECGLLESEARELNIGFVSRMLRGRPWVRVKLAATLDGKTALRNGVSQWITGAPARRDGQHWRARACAILSGIGTVLADDPQLSVRDIAVPRQPLRIIADSRLETPSSARVLEGGRVLLVSAFTGVAAAETLRSRGAELLNLPGDAGRVDLAALMQELGRRGINELHVEAGAQLSGALLAAGLADELLLYMAPCLAGDKARGMFDLPELELLDGSRRLAIHDMRMIGSDLRVIARFS